MKITGTLLVVSLLALASLAPSAYPQRRLSEEDLLNQLTLDVLRLTDEVKQFKTSMDVRGSSLTKLVESMLDRFATLDQTLTKLNDSIGGIRTDNEKTARDLAEVRVLVDTLKGNVGDVGDDLSRLNLRVGTVSDKITTMSTKEEVLPSAPTLWMQAYSDFSAGTYAIAISEFQDFLAQFPKDQRAAAAQVHIGKSYSAQKQYDKAEIAFDEALQKYPGSDQTCTALYEKGLAQREQKNIPGARTTLQTAVKECPAGSAEANSAAASLKSLPPR